MSKEPKQYEMCVIGHAEAAVITVANANVIIDGLLSWKKHKRLIYIYLFFKE